jgi:hypothetical protein
MVSGIARIAVLLAALVAAPTALAGGPATQFDATVARMMARAGLPRPDPVWTQEFAGHGYRAIFARVHRSRSFAPSRLVIIASRPVTEPADPAVPRAYIDAYRRAQGGRLLKTHATVFATSDIEGLIERVRGRGLRHRVDPVTPELPHPRLWVGVTSEAPGDYRADDDAGLFFEAIPTQGLGMRSAPSDPPPPPPEPLAPGQMARVVAREHLVRDLDAALRILSRNLELETAGPVREEPGARRAVLAMTMPHAATLELVQPLGEECEAGRYLARWGPGPFYTRIAVAGLEAKAEDLRRRGTDFHRPPGDPPRLRVDIDGVLLEFVDLAGQPS